MIGMDMEDLKEKLSTRKISKPVKRSSRAIPVKVFIDKKAQLSILGTEMDYQESKLAAEFVFNNPNISGTCGCGESFSM
jgi:iron-sulfur cluster assembly accessory protein